MKIMYPVLTVVCTVALGGIYVTADDAITHPTGTDRDSVNGKPAVASQFAYTLAAYHNPPAMPQAAPDPLDAPVIIVEQPADEVFTLEDAQERWKDILVEARNAPVQTVKKNLHRPEWPTTARNLTGGNGSYTGRGRNVYSRYGRNRGGRYSGGSGSYFRGRAAGAAFRNGSVFTRSRIRNGR